MNSRDLFRVDDRLIHGQVMVGWVITLGIKELILVNDRVASDSWQKEAFSVAVNAFSEDTAISILSKSEALTILEKPSSQPSSRLSSPDAPLERTSPSSDLSSEFPSPCSPPFPEPHKRRMIVVESVKDTVELFQLGLKMSIVNLGGIHMRPGREMVLPYLYLDSQEMKAILELSRNGIKVIAKDLPESKEIDVVNLIKQKKCK